MTDSEKTKLLDLLQSFGFEGCNRGKPVCRGISYNSLSSMVKDLSLDQAMASHKDLELKVIGLQFKERKNEVFAVISSVKFNKTVSVPEGQEVFFEGSSKIGEGMMENISLFRTVLADGFTRFLEKGQNNSAAIMVFSHEQRRLMPAGFFHLPTLLSIKGMNKEDISSLPLVWPSFNPYTTDLTFKTYASSIGTEVLAINTYCPPKWRFVKASPGYSGIIKQLMENLFPLEEEREYVFDWLRQAIVGRNETVLVLVGDRGVGKTLFSKLLFSLVGEQYSAIAKRETLTEKFNNVLFMARAIAFEETGMEGDPEAIERMKAFCNTKLSIEFKGENAFTAENYASMIMSLNGNSRLGVKPQERRFSIPKLGVNNFNKIVPEVEIVKLSNQLDAEEKSEEFLEYLSEFGEFLLARPASETISTPLRGQAYYEITAQSLAEWETAIINYVIENGEIGKPLFLKDIKRSMGNREVRSMFPVKDATISSFLQDYRHYDTYKLGNLTRIDFDGKHNNVQVIMPNEHFLKAYGAKYKEGAVIVKDTEVEDDIL